MVTNVMSGNKLENSLMLVIDNIDSSSSRSSNLPNKKTHVTVSSKQIPLKCYTLAQELTYTTGTIQLVTQQLYKQKSVIEWMRMNPTDSPLQINQTEWWWDTCWLMNFTNLKPRNDDKGCEHRREMNGWNVYWRSNLDLRYILLFTGKGCSFTQIHHCGACVCRSSLE